MIAVLQIILKILGIILLSILGIFIVLLLMTLFIPVRYRIQGNYKDELKCRGKVTWLFHLVSVSFIYEKGISTSVRILGIPLSVFKKKNVATKLENSKAKIKKEDTASFVDTPNTEDVSQPITLKDVVTDETTEKTIEVKSRDENNTEKISIINKIKNKISSIKKKTR